MRPVPILFIHGFNGAPSDWTQGGFRQFLLTGGELDPNLIRVFRYGTATDGTYNNRGDIRQIAARLAGSGVDEGELLACSIDRLSQDSVAKGGRPEVTIVAHSMGGIVARYYLSREERDSFGTIYRGNVGRLIQIATPNLGVKMLWLAKLAPRKSPVWWLVRLLELMGLAPAKPATTILEWESTIARFQAAQRQELSSEVVAPKRVLITDSPAVRQLMPGSALLTELNTPGTMPGAIECHTFYGDVRFHLKVQTAQSGKTLMEREVSFGDLEVSTDSARAIPFAASTPHAIVHETDLNLNLRVDDGVAAARSTSRSWLPEAAHSRLLTSRRVHAAVRNLVAG